MDAVASVNVQTSRDWELCIVNSTDEDQTHNSTDACKRLASPDGRIKVRHVKNQGISGNTNLALEMATGDYVGLLDADDLLTPNAIQRVIEVILANPEADFVYSDEDKVNDYGATFDPYHKPDWSPDTLMSKMYTCHFGVYRTALLRHIGGFRPEFDGAQDYDMVLRFTERTENIVHIPEILYHWRVHPGSTASAGDAKPYAELARVRAAEEALFRRGEPGRVEILPIGMHNVHYHVLDHAKVSIIVPMRDGHCLTDRLLRSLFDQTTYPNYEVIVVDNGSVEPETEGMLDYWKRIEPKRLRIIRDDSPFNYAAINNRAVAQSDGKFVVLLNNDTEVISPDWLTDMVGYAQRSRTGVVGAKLLYPDRTIQHAGVVLGLGGAAGHTFVHCSDTEPGYFGRLLTVSNYSALTAACIMVRRDVFDEVGGLETGFAVAFNDVDFCIKVREAGYLNVYLPFVKLVHHESKSRGYENTPEKRERFDKETDLLKSRWPSLSSDPFYNRNLSLQAPYQPKPTQHWVSHDPWYAGPKVFEARF